MRPRIRVTERELEEQILTFFKSMEQPDDVKDWFAAMLREWSKSQSVLSLERTQQLQRELTQLRQQKDRLLNLRLLDEIDAGTFASKSTELRNRMARLTLEMETTDRGSSEQADLAIKVFELSQTLVQKWLTSGFSAKRQLLESCS